LFHYTGWIILKITAIKSIKSKVTYLLCALVFFGITGWGPFCFFFPSKCNTEAMGTQTWVNREIQIIDAQANNIDPQVLRLSLTAYLKARVEGLDTKQMLTIIDYSKPSNERRLWVVDLKSNKVLFNTWVAHGKNSGKLLPTSFSNDPGSLKSSLGVFVTTRDPYMGDNGYSLRLQGLERGINDNAYRRDIVVHGAWYADPNILKKYAFLGRSWGCPAVSETLVKPLIDTIKNNTVVIAYYPDNSWLKNSLFLGG
jgi:hypothetical protein